ncbi:MAG: PQQ-dependent sugar dehydrogenase [Actinomycetota bacterium]|nr:PQQ-dependent sugar dehydrogenase [Actinomycetota bacterium]
MAAALMAAFSLPGRAEAAPSVVDPDLSVRTAASGLDQPISMAFIGRNDMLVLEKASGRVKRVVNGVVHSTVLDLPVNSASERGLLGIALHPHFFVTGRVYLFWSESTTGADSADLATTPLLGNRVDRFYWNGSALTLDRNIIKLRAFQADAGQPLRGNHDGGVLRFGPDKKLYVVQGDTGRRGQLQNLVNGPFGPGIPDDQFGGPEPDDAHLTGHILRLNDDGTAPHSNPFFRAGARMGGQVGANVQKLFAYGLRNSFGMAFDPVSGDLWEQENGDDSFSEINRATPGFNSGWAQIMGPPERIHQFKEIETTVTPVPPDPFAATYFGLQQIRWLPTNIADSPSEALSRLFMLPGSHYSAPEFSWKYEVAPAGIGFLDSKSLGRKYKNDLFAGAARVFLEGGALFRFELSGNRRSFKLRDPRLQDRVADNRHKWEITESETILFGRNFGIGTDVQTGPNGNLFVVSLTDGAVYEIFRPGKPHDHEDDDDDHDDD